MQKNSLNVRQVEKLVKEFASKVDKLKASERNEALLRIIRKLNLSGDDIIIPFSSVKGTGVEEFWCYVNEIVLNNGGETNE